MTIQFKDFFPEITKQGWFRKEYATLEETLEKANGWITQNNVQILNVETVVLPNIGEGQTTAIEIGTSGEMRSSWYQVIRVWYIEKTIVLMQ